MYKQLCVMVPSIVHTLISILSRFGSQFYKYNFLYWQRVGRQSIRHPLNSDLYEQIKLLCIRNLFPPSALIPVQVGQKAPCQEDPVQVSQKTPCQEDWAVSVVRYTQQSHTKLSSTLLCRWSCSCTTPPLCFASTAPAPTVARYRLHQAMPWIGLTSTCQALSWAEARGGPPAPKLLCDLWYFLNDFTFLKGHNLTRSSIMEISIIQSLDQVVQAEGGGALRQMCGYLLLQVINIFFFSSSFFEL